MSELRHDPIQRRWVIISEDRGKRPRDFQLHPADHLYREGFCPFCPGNEDKTPPEIYAIRREGFPANSPGWDVRVVPNRFPALQIEGQLEKRGVGVYDRMRGIGAHEVIIDSPNHQWGMADFTVDHLVALIEVYRARWLDLSHDARFRYMLIFKNQGVAAGASLSHSHTQIIATPVTPRTVSAELESAQSHYQLKTRCLFCDILDYELDRQERIIVTNDLFVAYAPYASRFPFEVMIMPRHHSHHFAAMGAREIRELATILKDTLLRIKIGLKDPPYNWVLHTVPNIIATPRRSSYWTTVEWDFHWHIEIMPRLTRTAGFEWGTDFYINPTPPENAAKFLREVFQFRSEARS